MGEKEQSWSKVKRGDAKAARNEEFCGAGCAGKVLVEMIDKHDAGVVFVELGVEKVAPIGG